jgi:hypothetical protein
METGTRELTVRLDPVTYNRYFISLFNFVLKLTDKEVELVVSIIQVYNTLIEKNTDEELIPLLLFSKENTEMYANRLGIGLDNLYAYKSSLKKKGALKSTKNGPTLDPRLVPVKKMVFNFVIV